MLLLGLVPPVDRKRSLIDFIGLKRYLIDSEMLIGWGLFAQCRALPPLRDKFSGELLW
jgi:hypothetical protein